eukprot:GHVN01060057.1.p1 GENE.GHVN01060057.1~~GHVN01060057.1.p1  ORF type:complete len:1018 (+),score=51.43 GHVN01060057.1:398-3055(+)
MDLLYQPGQLVHPPLLQKKHQHDGSSEMAHPNKLDKACKSAPTHNSVNEEAGLTLVPPLVDQEIEWNYPQGEAQTYLNATQPSRVSLGDKETVLIQSRSDDRSQTFAPTALLSDVSFTTPMCQLIYSLVHSQIDRLSAHSHNDSLSERNAWFSDVHDRMLVLKRVTNTNATLLSMGIDANKSRSAQHIDNETSKKFERWPPSSIRLITPSRVAWPPSPFPVSTASHTGDMTHLFVHVPTDSMEERARALWATVATSCWYFFRLVHYVRQENDDVKASLPALITNFEPYSLAAACTLLGVKTEERRAVRERRHLIGSRSFLFKQVKAIYEHNKGASLKALRMRRSTLESTGADDSMVTTCGSAQQSFCFNNKDMEMGFESTESDSNSWSSGSISKDSHVLRTQSTADSIGGCGRDRKTRTHTQGTDRLDAVSPMSSLAEDPFPLRTKWGDSCAADRKSPSIEGLQDLEVTDPDEWAPEYLQKGSERDFAEGVQSCEQVLLSVTDFSLQPPSPLEHVDLVIDAMMSESLCHFKDSIKVAQTVQRWASDTFGDREWIPKTSRQPISKFGVMALTHIRPLAYHFAFGVCELPLSLYYPQELIAAVCVYAAGTVVDMEIKLRATLEAGDHGKHKPIHLRRMVNQQTSPSYSSDDTPYDTVYSLLSVVRSRLLKIGRLNEVYDKTAGARSRDANKAVNGPFVPHAQFLDFSVVSWMCGFSTILCSTAAFFSAGHGRRPSSAVEAHNIAARPHVQLPRLQSFTHSPTAAVSVGKSAGTTATKTHAACIPPSVRTREDFPPLSEEAFPVTVPGRCKDSQDFQGCFQFLMRYLRSVPRFMQDSGGGWTCNRDTVGRMSIVLFQELENLVGDSRVTSVRDCVFLNDSSMSVTPPA